MICTSQAVHELVNNLHDTLASSIATSLVMHTSVQVGACPVNL